MKNKGFSPFKHLCVTIGNLPSSYVDSLSYYECLMWLTSHLDGISEATTELQEKFIELKNYVDTYFDNLDVQEEINNKLDEMAESGELEEIISTYIQSNAVISYRTLTDLIASQNLFDGETVETMGNTTYLDGGGRKYLIREIINTDVVDGVNIIALTNFVELIAELIPVDLYDDINNINDEIDDINDEIDKIKAKKRMLLFGDSWGMPNYPYVTSQSDCWYNKVADFLNANLTNYAQSGAGFLINNNTIIGQINSAISTETNPEEVDYIFVIGGYNDLNFTDNLSYSTITSAVTTAFNTLTNTFTNAKVYFLADNTPYKLLKTETGTQSTYYNTYGFYQYFEAAIMECNSTNITIINMIPFLLGFTDALNETLHPNDKGMKILSKSIIDTLCGSYTRQSIVTGSDVYSLVVAEPGSPTLSNTKNIINQDYIDVIFRLVQTHSDNSDLMYAYYVDELPLAYLPDNISVISTNGKKTISVSITKFQSRNLMQIQLPAQTTGTFDIVLRIPLK